MIINKDIFREYDIRGIYPGEVNKEIAFNVGGAFASYIKKLSAISKKIKIIVGRDVRTSSAELCEAFIKGSLSVGVDIVDIGVITTPTLYFGINLLKASGGAVITASHNPKEYNGFKFALKDAEPLSPSDILPYLEVKPPSDYSEDGTVEKMNILSAYTDFLASHVDKNVAGTVSVVADASNGSGGAVLKEFFDKVGVSYWPLYFDQDGTFPNHSPNPLEKDSQQSAKELVIHKNADFGFILDADGDRIIFIDERGKLVRGDIITSLLIKHLAKRGDYVLIDSSASKIVIDVGESIGVAVSRVKTGHTNIKRAMKEKDAILAGELSGHYYFRDFFYADSALFALAMMLNIFASSRRTLSSMVESFSDEPYKEYFHSKEYNFQVVDKDKTEKIFRMVKEKYSDGEQLFMDGISVEYPDRPEKGEAGWWFNLRSSNTEPVIRLNIEATSKELLDDKIQELTSLISQN